MSGSLDPGQAPLHVGVGQEHPVLVGKSPVNR